MASDLKIHSSTVDVIQYRPRRQDSAAATTGNSMHNTARSITRKAQVDASKARRCKFNSAMRGFPRGFRFADRAISIAQDCWTPKRTDKTRADAKGIEDWGWRDLNPQQTDYESAALTD